MPTVETLNPQMLWTTIYGVFAVGLLFLIGFRVYDAIHTILMRRKQRRESERPDFADQVSQKVIEKLEPRFKEIEKNLDKDKARLETHENMLTQIKDAHDEIHDGLSAICKFMLVASTYGSFGDNEKVREASTDLQNFLAEKL